MWRRELASGRETQITFHGGYFAIESYDAKTLYYSRFEEAGLWSVPVSGGEEKRITDAPHRGYAGHFAVAEAGVYLLDTEAEPGPTIMYYDFQTRQITPTLTVKEIPLAPGQQLASSRDGRTLFFSQSPQPRGSITMVESFQ